MDSNPAEMFKALAVDTRVRIIELLKAEGSLGTNIIAEKIGITPAAASQHLKTLKQAGLVRSRRQGYWVPYSIDEEALECCRQALNEVCTCGCPGSVNPEEGRPAHSHAGEAPAHAEGRPAGFAESEADLGRLQRYERQLERELKAVRSRLSEVAESGRGKGKGRER